MGIDHQRGQYYEHCKRSTEPRDLKAKLLCQPLPSFSRPRGDLKFWGEDDGPTVVVWESLSESEQEQWSKKMGKSKDWVVWCSSRKKDEEQRPLEVDGKEIFSNRSKQAKPKVGEKTDKKGGPGKGK